MLPPPLPRNKQQASRTALLRFWGILIAFGAVVGAIILLVVLMISRAYREPQIDPTKFNGVQRAAKALESATAIGVTIVNFRELVQNLGTELLMSKQRVKTNKEELVQAFYARCFQMYRTSLRLWEFKIRSAEPGLSLGSFTKQYNELVAELRASGIEVSDGKIDYEKESQALWQLALENATAADKAIASSSP